MASEKVLQEKSKIIEDIKKNYDEFGNLLIFTYQGLRDADAKEIRRELKNVEATYKIYKNTLVRRAFNDMKLDGFDESLVGPTAIAFGKDPLSMIKVIAKANKKSKNIDIREAYLNGELVLADKVKVLATMPSREELLTMLAAQLMAPARELALGLNMLCEKKEEESK